MSHERITGHIHSCLLVTSALLYYVVVPASTVPLYCGNAHCHILCCFTRHEIRLVFRDY
jgi:hypothetical protein